MEWEGRGWKDYVRRLGGVGREGKGIAETGGVEWGCGARDSGDWWC